MTEQPPSRRVVAGYLAGVGALSTFILGLLVGLFVTRIPEFTDVFVRDPAGAVREDPIAVLAIVALLVAMLLLVVLIVVFGARYGPGAEESATETADEAATPDEE